MVLSEVRDKSDFLDGVFILIDKPLGWSSFDVVKKVKSILSKEFSFKKIKIGHGGTLDPLASGLLIIGTGKSTKLLQKMQEEEKEYVANIFIGATTPSFDLETEIDKTYSTDHITINLVQNKLNDFIGNYDQVPPLFSAKWINGKRAYEFARQGREVEMKSVNIQIYELELLDFKLPDLTIRVKCSKGTYIRSLANDIGAELKCGGYMSGLKRTKSGGFSINDSVSIEEFKKIISNLSEVNASSN